MKPPLPAGASSIVVKVDADQGYAGQYSILESRVHLCRVLGNAIEQWCTSLKNDLEKTCQVSRLNKPFHAPVYTAKSTSTSLPKDAGEERGHLRE